MPVTPASFNELDALLDREIELVKPTKTYRYDFSLNRILGMTDGKDATFQAVRKIFSTQKYAHEIYDWRYGHELHTLVGMPKEYAKSEIERMIREAALQDDRVTGISNYRVEEEGIDFVRVSVTIDTITMPFVFDLEVPW